MYDVNVDHLHLDRHSRYPWLQGWCWDRVWVWYGMVWYGMVWYGMVWYGMVCYGMVWKSSTRSTNQQRLHNSASYMPSTPYHTHVAESLWFWASFAIATEHLASPFAIILTTLNSLNLTFLPDRALTCAPTNRRAARASATLGHTMVWGDGHDNAIMSAPFSALAAHWARCWYMHGYERTYALHTYLSRPSLRQWVSEWVSEWVSVSVIEQCT